MVFMKPNNEPAWLGAKSWGFIANPTLLVPKQPIINDMSSRADSNDDVDTLNWRHIKAAQPPANVCTQKEIYQWKLISTFFIRIK